MHTCILCHSWWHNGRRVGLEAIIGLKIDIRLDLLHLKKSLSISLSRRLSSVLVAAECKTVLSFGSVNSLHNISPLCCIHHGCCCSTCSHRAGSGEATDLAFQYGYDQLLR